MPFDKVKIGDILTIKHGWAFKGEFFANDGDLIVVTPGNFHDKGGFKQIKGKEKFYTDTFPQDYLLSKNDLIIAMTEQADGLLGSPALVPHDNIYLHNQRIGLIKIIDDKKVNKFFIYYLFFTEELRKIIGNKSTGTKVRHTAPKSIYNIDINLPPLKIQNKIATLLSNYDNLIQNNTKRIKLLEEMAGEIYKEWFVRLRFPEYEKSKIIDGIPKKWKKQKLGDIYNTSSGGTPSRKKDEYYNGNIPWIKTGELKNIFVLDTKESITEDGLNNSSAKLFKKDTVIIAMYCAMPYISILMESSSTNQACCALLPKKSFLKYSFSYFFIKHAQLGLIQHAHGAAQQNLSQEIVSEYKVIFPTEDVVVKYINLVQSNFDEIKVLMKKNRILKQTKDLLLPRLMSGKLDLENIEIL